MFKVRANVQEQAVSPQPPTPKRSYAASTWQESGFGGLGLRSTCRGGSPPGGPEASCKRAKGLTARDSGS